MSDPIVDITWPDIDLSKESPVCWFHLPLSRGHQHNGPCLRKFELYDGCTEYWALCDCGQWYLFATLIETPPRGSKL